VQNLAILYLKADIAVMKEVSSISIHFT
jgi:hypothetical protein